jgi:hypothetical protein
MVVYLINMLNHLSVGSRSNRCMEHPASAATASVLASAKGERAGDRNAPILPRNGRGRLNHISIRSGAFRRCALAGMVPAF